MDAGPDEEAYEITQALEKVLSLKQVIEGLGRLANSNEERAYRILGARPGPGIDVLMRPEYPINGKWHAEGLTQAGRNFVAKFWFEQPLSNQKMAEMKKQMIDWQLTWRVIVPMEPLED